MSLTAWINSSDGFGFVGMKIFLIITAGFIFLFAFHVCLRAQANCVDSAFNADTRKFVSACISTTWSAFTEPTG